MGRTIPSVAVVDSDPTNCLLLREVCQSGGWRIAGCAHDAEEGLALLAEARPDCLITDYSFGPRQSGLNLIAEAKELLPQLFTIIVTGWDINELATHVNVHQPDRILRKPIPPHLLLNLLESIYGTVNARH